LPLRAIKYTGALIPGIACSVSSVAPPLELLNGLLVTKAAVAPIHCDLWNAWMLYGVNYWYMKG
jgi:hypothetical protein